MSAGFSYKPPPRAPFTAVLQAFKTTQKPILSVDIPSGWDVEQGKLAEDDFTPSALLPTPLCWRVMDPVS